MKIRNKAVPAVYLILKKGNEVLLGRRINTGYFDGWYTVPSGHVEEGELPLAALSREVEEEIGLKINKDDVSLVHTMYRAAHDETGQRVDLFFVTERWKGEPKNTEANKCDELDWFPLDNLPEKVMPYVQLALENYQKGTLYSETPFDKKHLNPNNLKL